MNGQADLGGIDRSSWPTARSSAAAMLLPLGWLLATVGYYGPWIAHTTAALTLSGVDMGEFVKFLPGIQDGLVEITRQLFYLPAFSVAVSVALLVGSQQLRFPWLLRVPMLLLAVLSSLQLLPPAWSPSSLVSAEFRLQTMALCICWLLLASFWLLGRLPLSLAALVSAVLSAAAMGLSAWQFFLARLDISSVYGFQVSIGWGFPLCMAGLAVVAAGGVMLVAQTRIRGRGRWASR